VQKASVPVPVGAQSPSAGSVVSRNGINTVVGLSYLRSHVTRYVELPANAGSGQFGVARVAVTIGADGMVQDVSCGPQASAAGIGCDAVVATIKQWAFSPFVVNGQPSPVVAHVAIISTAGGVSSTVSPGWSSE